MTAGPTTPTVANRWRTWRWVGAALIVIAALATISTLLTAPNPGGLMDPRSTSPQGTQALVTLLREHGVDVVVADTVAEATQAARPDSLMLIGDTFFMPGDDQLRELAGAPGDRLVIAPTSSTRAALTPDIRIKAADTLSGQPDCDLPEANRAGTVHLGATDAYTAADDDTAVTRCYGGALVRYRDGSRTVTVVGTADFLTNSTLLPEGNAALAMNLAGSHPRLVWYAPQRFEGENTGTATLSDLVPKNVHWLIWQLWLVVALIALWKARRMGPLVAEDIPVVVRASETVEGRGRLYRSRRARDRAAEALRTATLQRLAPRLGLGANAQPPAIVAAITARSAGSLIDPVALQHNLFGPAPATDDDLVQLARALDNIERQVAHS
ncbi:MAG: DUF4350 domain-containing protein [Mycobacterium sp.]